MSTASTIELPVTAHDHRVAGWAAAAVALTLAEAAIPTPVPGIKPGLGNIIVLWVLLRHGWTDAAWVSLLRVVAAGLAFGQFLSPAFFMSLAGALASLAVLGVSSRVPPRWLGPVGHSVLAAFAHIGAQLLVARWWLIGHDGVLVLAPPLLVAALVFGVVNGMACQWLLQHDDPGAWLDRWLGGHARPAP